MKTKQLKKYPIPVLMMAITFGLTLLLPYLSGYLIDNVLASYDEQKLWGWFGVTFLVAVVSPMLCPPLPHCLLIVTIFPCIARYLLNFFPI